MAPPHAAFVRPLSRRTFLGLSLSAGGSWVLRARAARATQSAGETAHGGWRPWLLAAGDELRPAAPLPASPAELAEVLAAQRRASVETLASIAHWDDPAVVLPWTNLALDLIKQDQPNPVRAGRALALLHVALFDTLVATEDARMAYPRPGPAADGAVTPLGPTPLASSTFPSEHAAVATAAATILAYLFPREPSDGLMALAEDATASRLAAGRAFPSDIDSGKAIGAAVAERALARGRADGSDRSWDGTGRLTGEGYWQPTPPGYVQQPVEPLAGAWRPWLLANGNQYRPAAPPPYGSPSWAAELASVQEAVARRTAEQAEAVHFWGGGPGSATPAGLWIEIARDLIMRDGLDPLRAARVLALTSVAMADGFICCWDAKFTYWTVRPITADPSLNVLIPTPPFPSYPSGHATISSAAATVLGHLFPGDAAELADKAEEARNSRLWAGIHYPIDNDMGAVGGGMIGRLVVARARLDSAA